MEAKRVTINGKLGTKLEILNQINNVEELTISNLNLFTSDLEFLKKFNTKLLHLNHVHLSELVDFNDCIERLFLTNISSTIKIDISNLKNLNFLKIYQCNNIDKLNLNNLEKLKELYINSSNINILSGTECLHQLQVLNLDGSFFKNSFFLPKNNFSKSTLKQDYLLTQSKPWTENL